MSRTHVGSIDIDPLRAPHALMWGADGLLYASCDSSGVVAVINIEERRVIASIETESHGCHMIAMLPDGSKLYAENEDDQPYVSVLEPGGRKLIAKVPASNGAAGIIASPDGKIVLATDNTEPYLYVIDAQTDKIQGRVQLEGHQAPAQRVRWSPDGRYVLITSTEEPLTTILEANLLRRRRSPSGPARWASLSIRIERRPWWPTTVAAPSQFSISNPAAPRPKSQPGKGIETLAYF